MSTTEYQHKLKGHHKTSIMMNVPANQLDAMGLSPWTNVDEIPTAGKYERRLALHDAVKAINQHNRPTEDIMFGHSKPGPTDAICHTPISLIQCTVTIPGAGVAGVDLVIPPDTYIFMKENKEWIQHHLTYSKGQTKQTQHLNVITSPEVCSISRYYSFVPKTAKENNEYITAYYNKHVGNNTTLTRNMIHAFYINFKCDYAFDRQEQMNDHCVDTHGSDSPSTLKT